MPRIPCAKCGHYIDTHYWPNMRPGDTCNSCSMAQFMARLPKQGNE
jgi:hypothetical protein